MAHASRQWIVQVEKNAFAADAASPTSSNKNGFVSVAAVTSKGFSIAGGTVDITADDDTVRTLLENGTGKALSITVEGLAESYAFRGVALSKVPDDVVLHYANPDVTYVSSDSDTHRRGLRFSTQQGTTTYYLFGTFIMTAYEETGGAPDGAVTFTATFENTGDWGYNTAGR